MPRKTWHQVGISSAMKQTNRSKKRSSSHFPFLVLPLEIRKVIYRLLLCREKPIGVARRIGLFPSILRTCHQILGESRMILYGENIFSMEIFSKDDGARAYFLNCDHFGLQGEVMWESRLWDMRRFDISIRHPIEESFRDEKAAVRAVCNVLSKIPWLDYLHIAFEEQSYDDRSYPEILESFTLLRNVQSVFLEGVPPAYTQYLLSKMTGCSPLDHLPRMYEALQCYAGPFDCCEEALHVACEAMEEDDVDRFKRVREEIITLVTERMANTRNNLFSHDASS